MARFILRRVLLAGLMLALLTLVTFGMLRAAPGDPVQAYLDPNTAYTEAEVDALRHRLGLDRPLPEQYASWAASAVQGDFGRSTQRERAPVARLIGARIGPTLLLMSTGLMVAVVLGVALGIVASIRPGGWLDTVLGAIATLGISSPAFLTALLGLFFFAVRLGWAPSGGMSRPDQPVTPSIVLQHLVLPALCFAVGQLPAMLRFTRAAMNEALGEDFIRTARAKGLAERRVFLGHAFRAALVPVITLTGATVGAAVGGAIFIESVFNWPGMGLLLVGAVEARDYPLIMALALVIGAGVLAINLLTDLLCAAVDPRIRLA